MAKPRASAKRLSPEKAHEMLENPPHGKPLSKKQRGYFGAVYRGKSRGRRS